MTNKSKLGTITVTMKDPDGVEDSLDRWIDEDALADVTGLDQDELMELRASRRERAAEVINKLFRYGEYATAEVDLDAGTARFVPKGGGE